MKKLFSPRRKNLIDTFRLHPENMTFVIKTDSKRTFFVGGRHKLNTFDRIEY